MERRKNTNDTIMSRLFLREICLLAFRSIAKIQYYSCARIIYRIMNKLCLDKKYIDLFFENTRAVLNFLKVIHVKKIESFIKPESSLLMA